MDNLSTTTARTRKRKEAGKNRIKNRQTGQAVKDDRLRPALQPAASSPRPSIHPFTPKPSRRFCASPLWPAQPASQPAIVIQLLKKGGRHCYCKCNAQQATPSGPRSIRVGIITVHMSPAGPFCAATCRWRLRPSMGHHFSAPSLPSCSPPPPLLCAWNRIESR